MQRIWKAFRDAGQMRRGQGKWVVNGRTRSSPPQESGAGGGEGGESIRSLKGTVKKRSILINMGVFF